MTEQTKTITFEGKQYDVPVWVNWVARDANGEIHGYNIPPYASNSHGCWYPPMSCSDIFLGSAPNGWENSLISV